MNERMYVIDTDGKQREVDKMEDLRMGDLVPAEPGMFLRYWRTDPNGHDGHPTWIFYGQEGSSFQRRAAQGATIKQGVLYLDRIETKTFELGGEGYEVAKLIAEGR
jgi:hypothetical protein